MKIKFGAIVTDGRGKLGGHVFSKNRSGSYMRTKTTPSNPNTSFQTFIRSLLTHFSQMWSTITSAQRASFNEAVSSWSKTNIFGDIKNPTGKNLFTRLNINLANVGLPPIFVAPEKVEIVYTAPSAVQIDINAAAIYFDDMTGAAANKVLISATPPQTTGTNFYKGKYRKIFSMASNATLSTDIFSAYVERFGTVEVGMNISFEIKAIAPNGQNTAAQTFVAVIV